MRTRANVWRGFVRFFNNLPIERKLLLASVIPLVALVLLSIMTYQSARTFADNEEQLNRVYLTQRTATEFLRLAADLESGFRGYVVAHQDAYLEPYQVAHDHILIVGDTLESMVQNHAPQRAAVQEAQRLMKRLISEKDRLIQSVRQGRSAEALHYIEQGQGRAIMRRVREEMTRFARLEQDVLNESLSQIADARSAMMVHIVGGSLVALGLMLLALHLIARSITWPLASLAKSVRSSTGTTLPHVSVLERRDELGELTRVISTMSEQVRSHLTKLQQSEADLRAVNQNLAASESKYRSIVDHAPLGIFTTKGMAMTFINRYNRILAGLNPDEEGDPEAIRSLIHPEDRDRVLSEFAKAVADNKPYETVFRFLHQDGTVRKVLSRRIPIWDQHGHIVMYQGFNIDITALDQMQTQLSRSERLATLGQVAAGIAHEIRNPLVGIGSTASLLVDEFDADDPRRADLTTILKETRRLDRIVNQIVDYARPREVVPMLFHLSEVMQEALKLLEAPLVAKHITAKSLVHPMLPQLHADRDQIKQVLLNLFQNGIEAMGEGGTITIAAFESQHLREAGITIDVSDSGGGIAPQDIPHVFKPFFTSGKHRGTGLGLAICRNIIEAHSGDIQISSQIGRGTTVRIWLPLRQQPKITVS